MPMLLVVTALLGASDVVPLDSAVTSDAWLDSERSVDLRAGRDAATSWLLDHSYVTSQEPRRGVPSFLWAERFVGARTPADQGLDATEAARQHLLRFASVYRLSGDAVARLVVSEVHDLKNGGAVVVGFARQREGVPFLRDELDVVMTAKLELVALTGSLATQEPVSTDFRLDASSAIAVAAQRLTGAFADPSRFPHKLRRGNGWSRYARGEVFTSEPRARRVYFDDAEAVLPAWHLELEVKGRLFSMVVSARDGRVLSFASLDREAAHTYRVWADGSAPWRPLDSPVGDVALPHPTGLPDGFTPPLVASTLVTLDHGGISTMDPWLPAGATTLSGNNANAFADTVAPDGFDGGELIVPSGSAAFDYAYDFQVNADAGYSQRAASATHAFFVVNQAHDVLYDLGFDEASGNAQASNLGRGGEEDDALLVHVHDFVMRNNASMRTPADGEAPRMNLALFTPARASTFTAQGEVATLNDGGLVFEDGGTFAVAVPVFERPQGWDVSGPLRSVVDGDGGLAGCDGWLDGGADLGAYAGSVVLLDVFGCSLTGRVDRARDAGVAALLLAGGCSVVPDPGDLVVACLGEDAEPLRAAMAQSALDGGQVVGRLQRPAVGTEYDVAFDTSVVVHEFGHLVTDRLIGDSVGLMNNPARGMGEGWSDFIALWLSLRPQEASRPGNDQWQGAFAIGGWVSQGLEFDGSVMPAHYFGVRRYPYSTDRSKNPLTFKHVGLNVPLPGTAMAPRADTGLDPNNAEVHNAGEVWASLLWDAQVKLLNRPGTTFDAARTAMGQYLVASLKATPVLPTFLEGRDAFLAVVFAASPTTDFPLVLDAFAARGLGVLAQSSDRRSLTNVPLAEDFTGQGGMYRLVSVTQDDTDDDCDADGVLDSVETGTVTVTLMNVGSRRLTQSRLRVSSSVSQLQLPVGDVAVPPSDPFSTVMVTLPASMARSTGQLRPTLTLQVTDSNIPLLQNRFETTAELVVNTDVLDSNTEDFNTQPERWVVDGEGAFPWEDGFVIRPLAGGNPDRRLVGFNPRFEGKSFVTSPPIAVGAGAFSFTFAHTWQFDSPTVPFDGGRLELSTDGVTFAPIAPSALSPAYNGTLRTGTTNPLAGEQAFVFASTTPSMQTVSLGTQYANRTVWLRFVIGSDSARSAPGWIIDDLTVTGATMPPFKQVIAHRESMCRNHPPSVSGTSSINVEERQDVTLIEGTTFDRDQDPLTVTWMQTSGPSVQLTGNTFTAPDVTPAGAVLGFRVTVTDGRGGTDSDEMTVTVRNVNRAPTLNGTQGPQMVTSGDTVTFEALGEDPDGDTLAFQWSLESQSNVVLDDVSQRTLTFVAPDVEIAEYISFKVVALDGARASEPAFVALIINPKPDSCQCNQVSSVWVLAAGLFLLRRRRR